MTFADIKAAVVGVGFIGVAHVEALRRLGVDVVGVVGRIAGRAAKKAASASLPRVYDSLDALLADPAVDVVHIATPNHLHAPQVRAVLEAGKHVVCEKPLALTAADARDLVARADAAGRVHAVCFNLRFYPLCHQARALVARVRSASRGSSPATTCRTGCSSTPTGTGGSSPTRRASFGRSPTSAPTGSTCRGSSAASASWR